MRVCACVFARVCVCLCVCVRTDERLIIKEWFDQLHAVQIYVCVRVRVGASICVCMLVGVDPRWRQVINA